MASEREIRERQETTLFDILKLMQATEEERTVLLKHMYERAQCGMTADEIDAVKERAARS